MTVNIDNFNHNIEATTATFLLTSNKLMAKKRKVYLHKRVSRSMVAATNNAKHDLLASAETSLPDLDNTFICKSPCRNCSFTSMGIPNIEKKQETKIDSNISGISNCPKELRICIKKQLPLNSHNSNNNCKSNVILEEYNCNCSCDENNCQQHQQQHHHHQHPRSCSSSSQQHHHQHVLNKHKLTQESLMTNRHNQEIQNRNSYYLLSETKGLEKAQTETENYMLTTSSSGSTSYSSSSSCATQLLLASTTTRTTATSSASSLDDIVANSSSNIHTTCLSINSNYKTNLNTPTTCNNFISLSHFCSRKSSFMDRQGFKQRFFTNFVMILKMLLVLITTFPSLSSLLPSTSRCRNIIKRHKHYQQQEHPKRRQHHHRHHYQHQNSSQLEQRLTHFNDQRFHYYHKQKTSSSPSRRQQQLNANVSYKNMTLICLSFLSICLPLSNALISDFETTLQSSLSVLERSARSTNDIAATNELESLRPDGEVRLTRPEKVCKSLDIRNDASSFRQLENCTVIEGFLLITLLNGNSFDDFNETYPLLTEVTDFLIVYQVHHLRSLGKILPNLSIIRGRLLFEGYALVVYSNSHLEDLGFTNLTTISKGGVKIEKNVMLCFVKSIDWSQIMFNSTDLIIEGNRDTVECPACPGDQYNLNDEQKKADKNELACKERNGHRYCWNNKSCQKFCPKRCKGNCIDENTCCNDSCLGGCSPTNLNDCISCRNLSISNTTCKDSCPLNTYSYLDRRCVTAETCVNVIQSKYENNRQETLVAYDGKCSTGCPEGYNKSNLTCIRCGDKCTKKCEGTTIDSVARAKELHGCTHIVGSPLIINIKRGGLGHLMEDLAYGLSSIQVISTALKVQGTYGLSDLKFFTNLRTIEGEDLIEGQYAFYVLENTDMETIWNINQTVRILKGTVYFHFNPKLCVAEINALLPMVNNKKSFDKTEVSEDSNGQKGSCNTAFLNVTVTGVGSVIGVVRIENPMKYEDDRTFIGYQFLHIEDNYKNATKHGFRPCEDGWEISEPSKETTNVFSNLKPYTQYAFYVKTLTISTERRNAQSPIKYFKTKSDRPKTVNKVQAYANTSYNIVINWLPPLTANGKLIKYKVRAIYDKRIQRIDSRNYCKDPLKEISKPEIPITKPPITEKPPVLPPNCKCSKRDPYDDDDIDATIHAGIEFENTLQNFVYVKRENKSNQSKQEANWNDYPEEESNSIGRNRRALNADVEDYDSFLLRHIRDIRTESNAIPTSTTFPPTYVTSTVDPHLDNGAPLYNESRMDVTGTYYEVFLEEVNASTTEFVFSKLKHFSWYMLGIEACREPEPGNDTNPCSLEVKTYVRTLKLDDVDRVDHLRATIEATNTTRSNIRLFWDRPLKPNGAVVSYTIFYQIVNVVDGVEEKKCIREVDYIEMDYQHNGYLLTGLSPGNYSIKIRANTLAGEGKDSVTIYKEIPPITLPPSVIAGITLGVIAVILIIGVAIYYVYHKRLRPPSDLKIFPSVNPHYISLQYIPDEWEVARDRVLQLNPLGQGSFGMVYEGILKGYNNSNEDTPCAIKTVNENATDRERMNFLNEACVMKQFDTFHVVRLLGVCSRGQPALVVMELMKHGDLKSYLRAHRPDERDENGIPILNRGGVPTQPPPLSRIYQMAIEIADGMGYLAAKKFVHRDLAARNCMVAADLTVKIGDFGMTRDIYENDYYRKGTKGLLPVRWMPPESLRDGVYSTASDVFSYGVVLWEMATLASQPYQGFSNDQVLRYVIDGGVMERPENCPDKLYMLMQKCWHHRPTARPTFMEIIRYLLDLASPHFRDVSFYHSEEGQQILAKEIAERNQRSGDVFHDHENEMEDVTTPLRLEEYNRYKLNMDNNSSIEHRGDSSMVIDDDAPHSPYSITGSPMAVSSTPDEQLRNSFNMPRIMNPHNLLNSAPSTSGGLRKSGPTSSHHLISHPHTHPYHRNLYQPTRYTQQQHARRHLSEDADAYVQPDFEPSEQMGNKRDSDEQEYEKYDPSPNYSEQVPGNVHDDDDDEDMGVHSTAGQNLLARPKPRQTRQTTIMPLSSSMPDDVIGQQAASSLHPSTASAASSNASSKTGTGKYLNSLMPAKLRNIRTIFNHKRSGSNASYKSTSSNPNSITGGGGAGGSSNNLTRGGRGKSMSGQNLGTIESGGSGSAGSYCANPRFFTPNSGSSASENPNYKRLDDYGGSSGGDTLTNKPKLSMSSNPNYQVLDESLNTTGGSSSNNPVIGSLHTSENPNYQIMQAPGSLHTSENPNYQIMQAPAAATVAASAATTTPITENVESYVMMNEPNKQKNKVPDMSGVICISNNPNYQMMGPLPPSHFLAAPSSKTVLPQLTVPLSRTAGSNLFSKSSSSSSAASTSSSHESEEEDDEDIPTSKRGIKSDRIPLSRRSSNDRSQKKKLQQNNRSRSQSSSSGKSSSNTTTTTSQQQSKTTPSSTLTLKEKWWKEQPSSQQSQQQQPPPNGFVGREAS